MAEAGARFESYVRSAMTEAEIASMAELGRRSGIAAPIWYTWFRGEKQPRRTSLTLAGQALDRTPEQLLAVWDGERPYKPRTATETADTLVSALRDQTEKMDRLTDELARGRLDQQEATDALLRAMATLVREPEGRSNGNVPDAPAGTPQVDR